MTNDQVRALLKIGEEALRKAQAVFVEDFARERRPEDGLTDEERRARLLSHFEVAPNHALTVDQVRQAAKAVGYDPRGLGALYNARTNWLRSEGDMRVMTEVGLEWLTTVGKNFLGDYKPQRGGPDEQQGA